MSEPKFAIGDQVILGEHQITGVHGKPCSKNWSPEMSKYVGTKATITDDCFFSDDSGSRLCNVDTNNWVWRVINMTPVKVADNKTAIRAEVSCKQCSRNNDIGVAKCWFCECNNPTLK